MDENEDRAGVAPGLLDVERLLRSASALLLDFNGTLSDDEDLIAELVAEVAAEELGVGLGRERYFAELVGRTEEQMFRVLAGGGSSDADIDRMVATFNRRYLDRVRAQRRITPAAEAFVREAHRRRLAIAVVTAASRTVVVPALSRLELLDAVDTVVALEDVEHSKPAPDCYLSALELLGFEAGSAVAFEDSRTGATAALAAGLPVVAVGPGARGLADLTPHAVDGLGPELFGVAALTA